MDTAQLDLIARNRNELEYRGEPSSGSAGARSDQELELIAESLSVVTSKSPLSHSERKQNGVFFSGKTHSTNLIESIGNKLSKGVTILDPCCGAGDLLAACAERLPLCNDLEDTLASWGHWLRGCDIYPEFVEITKDRLAHIAFRRHGHREFAHLGNVELFPHVQHADALRDELHVDAVDVVVMNPPFVKRIFDCVDGTCWTSGKTSLAAIFVDRFATKAADGTQLVALLPDVLRAGTFYGKWRDRVSCAGKGVVQLIGRFNASVDVDVFILDMTIGGSVGDAGIAWLPEALGPNTIESQFRVYVGPLVVHRHEETGPELPYIFPKLMHPWSEVSTDRCDSRRRFSGRVAIPPFVAIRRTSSPSDSVRIICNLVTGASPVIVDNHLIVCEPRDGRLESCERLMESLKSPLVTQWLNQRIRCRHLTIGSIKQLPYEA